MLGFNKVFIMGNLTRDPELKYTPNGQAVASFGIATNRRWNTPEGERREEAEFHNIVVWGKSAETINQYVKKGNPLFVEGRLKTQNWEGPDGIKRQRTEIIVEGFQFLGSGGATNTGTSGQQPNYRPTTPQQPVQNNNMQSPQNFGGAKDNSSAGMDNNMPADINNNVMPNDNPFSNTPDELATNPDDISIDDIPF